MVSGTSGGKWIEGEAIKRIETCIGFIYMLMNEAVNNEAQLHMVILVCLRGIIN